MGLLGLAAKAQLESASTWVLPRDGTFAIVSEKIPWIEATSLISQKPHRAVVMLGISSVGSPLNGSTFQTIGTGTLIENTNRVLTAAHVVEQCLRELNSSRVLRAAFITPAKTIQEVALQTGSWRRLGGRDALPDIGTFDISQPLPGQLLGAGLKLSGIKSPTEESLSLKSGFLVLQPISLLGRNEKFLIKEDQSVSWPSNIPRPILAPIRKAAFRDLGFPTILHDAPTIPTFSGAGLLIRDLQGQWTLGGVHRGESSRPVAGTWRNQAQLLDDQRIGWILENRIV